MERVEIGVVARPHGVRGELRIHLYNPESTAFDVVDEIFVGDTCYALTSARTVKGGALVRLDKVDSRNLAEALLGKPVMVLRDSLELDEDDVLLDELIGCQVELEDGTSYGEIAAVHTGVQDRLVIHDGNLERYLPLVDVFVLKVDRKARRVVVAPPEDLPEWER